MPRVGQRIHTLLQKETWVESKATIENSEGKVSKLVGIRYGPMFIENILIGPVWNKPLERKPVSVLYHLPSHFEILYLPKLEDVKAVGDYLWETHYSAFCCSSRKEILSKLPYWISVWIKACRLSQQLVDRSQYETNGELANKTCLSQYRGEPLE